MAIRIFLAVILSASLVGCGSNASRSDETKMVFPNNASKERALSMYLELGQGYLQTRDIDNARRAYTKALRVDERAGGAFAGMAIIYQIEGEYEKAEEYFERAVRLTPKDSQIRNNYGAFLYSRGRYEDALAQVEIAADDTEYTGRVSAFTNLAFAHQKLENYDKAEYAFKRALRLDPKNASALLNLSQMYYERDDYPEAKRYFDAYQTNSAHSAASLWLGVLIEVEYKNEDEIRRLGSLLGSNFPYSQEFLEYRRLGIN